MSQYEDVELKELVTEVLEKNGVLAKIRAQLRANIFMTLENENGQRHHNPKLKNILDTQYGFLAFILIQELLDFCDLVQTSSIFKSESGQGRAYVYEGRDVLIYRHFKFAKINDTSSDIPILVRLIALLLELCKIEKGNNDEYLSNADEKSFESDACGNADTQNNTFVVNSGRSDNYDLSFVSDADSSISSTDKKKGNSTVSSDSVSTELHGENMKIIEYGNFVNSNTESEDSLKPDANSAVEDETSGVISEALISESGTEKTNFSEELNPMQEENNKRDNAADKQINNSNSKTYSKYLKEKENNSKLFSNHNPSKESNVNKDEPLDVVMRHIIQSRMGKPQSGGEESLSEELQAFETNHSNEDSNGVPDISLSLDISEDNLENTNTSISPVRNILDETLPESPKTKQKVIEHINSLKMKSLRITDDDKIIFGDCDVMNLKNLNSNKKNAPEVLKQNEINTIISSKEGKKEHHKGELLIESKPVVQTYTNSTTIGKLVDSKNNAIVKSDVNRDTDMNLMKNS